MLTPCSLKKSTTEATVKKDECNYILLILLIFQDLKFSSAPSSEVEFTEQSDSTMSESESESEDEIPSVDDCVKCLCEDECELGFMIQVSVQCKSRYSWQISLNFPCSQHNFILLSYNMQVFLQHIRPDFAKFWLYSLLFWFSRFSKRPAYVFSLPGWGRCSQDIECWNDVSIRGCWYQSKFECTDKWNY